MSLIWASICLSWASRASSRFSAASTTLSRISSSLARASSSVRRSAQPFQHRALGRRQDAPAVERNLRPGRGRRRILGRRLGLRLWLLLAGRRVDGAGDVRKIEHLLRPGSRSAGPGGGDFRCRTSGAGRRLRALLDRPGDVAVVGLAQRVSAVEDQPRRFQDEQRADRDQHDRDEPEIADEPGHAATCLTRSRSRSANDRAAAATAFGSGAVRGRGHVVQRARRHHDARQPRQHDVAGRDLAIELDAAALGGSDPFAERRVIFLRGALELVHRALRDFGRGDQFADGRPSGTARRRAAAPAGG